MTWFIRFIESARIEGDGFSPGEIPKEPAAKVEFSVFRSTPKASKALLILRLKGVEEALRIPLVFLPPEAGSSSPGPDRK